jgi:hypothetical protein
VLPPEFQGLKLAVPIAGFWITDRRLDLVQLKAKRRVYIAVSPKGFSQVVAIMPPNGRAMVMTLLLMEKSVAVLPERSKLFESHWSNQWLTSKIELLRKDHPNTLRGMTLLEEGPEHYAAWKHLLVLIAEEQQNAFVREFGQHNFDYAAQHPSYGAIFNEAMTHCSTCRPHPIRISREIS